MAFRDITTDHMGLQTTLASLTLAAAAGFAGSAHAAYTSYFGEDLNDSETTPLASTPKADLARQTFLSKLINVGTETFETQSVGTPAPLVLKFPGSNGNVTATLTGGDGIVKSVTPGTTDDSGRYSVPSASTSRYWDVAAGADGAPSTFNVSFGQAIAAFGFYGIDIGDFGGQLEVLLFNGDTQVGDLTVDNTQGDGGSTGGSVLYFGLIAQDKNSLFTSVRFQMTTVDLDVFAFDNFTIAELSQVSPPGTVPEPGTLALMAGALLALGVAQRKRA